MTLIMGCLNHDLSYNPDESIKNNIRSIFGVDFPEWKPWIYDKTRNTEVHIATAGQDLHAIMILWDFERPLERQCIKTPDLIHGVWVQ